MTAHQDSTTPATRPCQTCILHKTLSKGLSPKLCQAKTQLHQLLFYKMRTPSAPIVSISGARPPRIHLSCCHRTQGINSWKAEVITNQLHVTPFWAPYVFWEIPVNNPARLLGLIHWLWTNPDLTRGCIKTNAPVALAKRSIFLLIIPGRIPPKCLPVPTHLVKTGLPPCPIHCPLPHAQ